MKRTLSAAGLALALVTVSIAMVMTASRLAFGYDVSGSVSAEGTVFPGDALHSGQESRSGSLALAPEFYREGENGSALIFAPFARLDATDDERTHLDIRELHYRWVGKSWEFTAGVGKVFWGATEFLHLVDIVNQTDLVEDIDGEDKLGQPMLHLALIREWGVLDLFALPFFRERTFPGPHGRPRPGLVVDTDQAVYESDDEEHHFDYALRYSNSIGPMDLGISYFNGTGREPTLTPGMGNAGEPVLVPFYELIDQAGLDLQVAAGQWLIKLEALRRAGQGEDYGALTGGFEYTFYGLAGTASDLGLIVEWAYDDRGDTATTPYENDVTAGVRLAFNDLSGSELLAGIVSDTKSSARIWSLEAGRRFGEKIRVTLEAYAFVAIPPDDPLYDLRNDDFLRLTIAAYF